MPARFEGDIVRTHLFILRFVYISAHRLDIVNQLYSSNQGFLDHCNAMF